MEVTFPWSGKIRAAFSFIIEDIIWLNDWTWYIVSLKDSSCPGAFYKEWGSRGKFWFNSAPVSSRLIERTLWALVVVINNQTLHIEILNPSTNSQIIHIFDHEMWWLEKQEGMGHFPKKKFAFENHISLFTHRKPQRKRGALKSDNRKRWQRRCMCVHYGSMTIVRFQHI